MTPTQRFEFSVWHLQTFFCTTICSTKINAIFANDKLQEI